ncbi:hypothetical protein [Deinococcus seoulensis]|uniref:hypothetical protein n=1 Tax=Deinococcus seoulensis TaxID=1837379 RepID=UPI00166DA33B|nr:hypothetical protein [Deinococcus seoulensis]
MTPRRFLNHTDWDLCTPCHFLHQNAFQRFSDTWKHAPQRCDALYLKSGIPEIGFSGIPDFGYLTSFSFRKGRPARLLTSE